MFAGITFAHQPDAGERPLSAHHRHRPREPFGSDRVAEVHFNVSRLRGRQFDLGGLQVHHRRAKAQPLLKRVIGATGEDAGFGVNPLIAGCRDRHAIVVHAHADNPFADQERGPGALGALAERRVEGLSIDDDRFDLRSRVFDRSTRRSKELNGCQRVEKCTARQVELVERFDGEDTRAMDGVARRGVLLEDDDLESGLGKLVGGIAGGSCVACAIDQLTTAQVHGLDICREWAG